MRLSAARKDELSDVKIRGNLIFGPIKVVECDPQREHFIYNSWHCSAYERKLCDKGLCNYIPMIFRNVVEYYKNFLEINVAMISVTPMDAHGYFNLSTSTGIAKGILDKADIVIVEVNENLPRVYGGIGDSIHISEVDMVVEGKHGPLFQVHLEEPTEAEIKIAEHIMPYISRQCHSPARHRRSSRHHRQDDRRLRPERPRDAHRALLRRILLYTRRPVKLNKQIFMR